MSLECDSKELVVCFADIRHWLRGIEGKSPWQAFTFLTSVYEEVLPIAEASAGQLVKVMGDAALIVWEPQDASPAVEASRRMREEFDKLQKAFGPCEPMTLAVAMALGPVIAGEMGPPSIRRFDVFGHAANLAARLLRGADFTITKHLAQAASGADLTGIDVVPGV